MPDGSNKLDVAQIPPSVVAFDRVFELAARLGDLMERDLSARGLSTARAEVLFVLHLQGPMVQRQLSQALRCTPRYVTDLIDALEAQGWVARSPHPTDRRATLVTLTERGTAAAARMHAERQEGASALFGDVPPDDLETFVAVLDQVLDRLGRPAPKPAP
ncbi:MAG TPA: MarR family transcriptional regulator [Ktedonobacterales bacterium]|nr:MarR family transcriptional regulator [Ktedonobacterales bacterium]